MYQLTGHLIPDSKLGAARTVRQVLVVASKPPKTESLHEVLGKQNELGELANVVIHSRRLTPIDAEVQVGRWKVIEEELKKRNLPVTGFGGYDKARESQWLMGTEGRRRRTRR